MIHSRLPGVHRLSMQERRQRIAEVALLPELQMHEVCMHGGLSLDAASRMVENAIGLFSLPMSVSPNMRVDGTDVLVPMVVEEPSVVAAVGQAALWVREGQGALGFCTEAMPAHTYAQLLFAEVPERDRAINALCSHEAELLARANAAVPNLVRRGGGVRRLRVRALGHPCAQGLALDLTLDCVDAMGANLANTVSEALRARVSELVGASARLAILSNLADERLVTSVARVAVGILDSESCVGQEVASRVAEASRLAEADVYRAVTHNKGIMNGVGAVAIATGNDWRALEAGAHGYASLGAGYKPLATWRVEGGELVGRLCMPMAVGTVGGVTAVHDGVKLALAMLGKPSARRLASVMASVGLASNLAALVALTTVGIQAGHMRLHARKSEASASQ